MFGKFFFFGEGNFNSIKFKTTLCVLVLSFASRAAECSYDTSVIPCLQFAHELKKGLKVA